MIRRIKQRAKRRLAQKEKTCRAQLARWLRKRAREGWYFSGDIVYGMLRSAMMSRPRTRKNGG